MKSISFFFFFLLSFQLLFAQVMEDKRLCADPHGIAYDEHANCQAVYAQRFKEEMVSKMEKTPVLHFPLRVALVQTETDTLIPIMALEKTITILNDAFSSAAIRFSIAKIEIINSDLILSNLTRNQFQPYNEFSKEHDLQDTISLYIFDYDPEFCQTAEGIISCGRTGGFSYILSELTNNVVLSKFDLEDHKIIAHEFGHFFGLHHTFEDRAFGKSPTDGSECFTTGDLICDTPPDPGNLYEVYVNYSRCEMVGNVDLESGIEFKPIIENYMSYYKPCYLKTYSFTKQQNIVLKLAAMSPMRIHLAIHDLSKINDSKN